MMKRKMVKRSVAGETATPGGKLLRDFRTAKNWTLEEMQDRLQKLGGDAGFSILSRVERGKHVPSFGLLTAVYRMTDGSVTPNDFLPAAVIKAVERNQARRARRD